MTPTFAFCILLATYVIGEIVAEKTRARLSTTLVLAVLLLVMFWCGLPGDIFTTGAISSISGVLVGILITSLGTMINFAELKRQWKTVVISLVGVIIGVGLIVVIAPSIIGHDMAIAGAPIFAGANTAALLMTSALNEKGLTELSSFVVLVLVTQNLIGIPVASQLLRADAKTFLKDPNNLKLYAVKEAEAQGSSKRKPLQLPELFNRPLMHLLKLALISGISQKLAGLTHGNVHWFVWCLLFGIILSELGFLDSNSLPRTQSSGLIMFITTASVFTTLAQTTPGNLISMIIPLLVVLGIGIIGCVIAGIVLGKLLKVTPGMAISMALTCTFGFPTTMLMSQEVAKGVGETEEERIAIENYVLPKMVTAGFVTVTISSVFIAGVVVTML